MRNAVLFLSAVVLFLSSCKGNGSLSFCEGKKPDGAGVNCGTVFSTGDVMVLVKSNETFETEKLKVKVFEESGGKKKLRETVNTNVKPDAVSTSLLIPLYSEGTFTITATSGERIIGTGTVIMRHQ